ncbi:4'-phosphopantetheinyl transferase family protein [Anaerosacchariphilus polymeriproducens]|uniref:4'-phosphopantetheinyl transferase domain-containing protein n=1 Tax=Anaerosacchariphilus polymeriproducens TaxID=1812858 RepID=A0A371AUN0_9FIRM|nr:4'-phosphopantetheinyl transferase superfamily protein [Anaerosacchariphilus polymeriproducens]RDU23284.1 hypothetical protein DWV06_10270 [Anaerosacchariphilus polymeriproducens]
MHSNCKIYLYSCNKKGHDSKNYLKYQRDSVNEILKYVMKKEFEISFHKSMIEKDLYGKPFLKDFPYIHYNISHCDGYIACGISNGPIGIDVENVREYPTKVLKRVFSDKEIEFVESANSKNLKFFQLWTLKESYIKAIGKGLTYPIDKVNFEILDDNEIKSNQSNSYFDQIFLEDGKFVLSVCTFRKSELSIEHWNAGGTYE